MYNNSEARKFIIQKDGGLIIGPFCEHNSYMHKELISDGADDCYGGGLVYIFPKEKLVLFTGKSYDFGKPDFSKMKYWDGYENDFKFVYRPDIDDEDDEIVIDMSNIDTFDD